MLHLFLKFYFDSNLYTIQIKNNLTKCRDVLETKIGQVYLIKLRIIDIKTILPPSEIMKLLKIKDKKIKNSNEFYLQNFSNNITIP